MISGDLDLSSRDGCYDACVATTGADVQVDLSATTFMDCAGYSALTTARRVVEADGGTLTWQGAGGEPARLLGLVAAPHRPVRHHGFGRRLRSVVAGSRGE